MTRSPSTRKTASINSNRGRGRGDRALPMSAIPSDHARFQSARSGEFPLEPARELDIDLQGRDVLAPLHPHNNLVGIERNMSSDGGQDFLPQQQQEVGLLAQ